MRERYCDHTTSSAKSAPIGMMNSVRPIRAEPGGGGARGFRAAVG